MEVPLQISKPTQQVQGSFCFAFDCSMTLQLRRILWSKDSNPAFSTPRPYEDVRARSNHIFSNANFFILFCSFDFADMTRKSEFMYRSPAFFFVRHAPTFTHDTRCCSSRDRISNRITYSKLQTSASIHPDVTMPAVWMPENTGVQPRRLVGHDFKVVFQPLNLKLRDHLNIVLGLLLLKEIKRSSWPRYEFNSGKWMQCSRLLYHLPLLTCSVAWCWLLILLSCDDSTLPSPPAAAGITYIGLIISTDCRPWHFARLTIAYICSWMVRDCDAHM